ncbi:GSCOCG00001217001-RA-CDS [Cotesia congregata]|uniref:Similar to Tbcb: Tubulin-folding cofactor B (Mus musculus) n=1 Tax=Cotesia congregata TaxID=51543 RepID=A0A8J2HF99_COTCN|nr:GSCOCG00001217001-RA-CDS [Cotesia congregata]CAG5097421.1 Similar to Tbcb: Tubulin-folding cofactor B (Mus musculus) [Cotesia congregata]
MAEYTVVTSDFINVSITSSGQKNCIERRFQKGITIDDFKGKLELLTGGNRSTMQLEVFDKNNKLICSPNEGSRLLGSYPIDDGMIVHVTDNFMRLDDDLANVPKFEISDDDYSKRPDTVKAFLAKNKLGKYNEEEMKQKEADKKREEESEIEWTKNFNPGDRCEISVPSQPKRRGTIMYVGKTDFKEGLWVGVKYDEPLGKNDGSVNGKRYFQCPPKYGGFVKPLYVKKGDFPEEDYDLDEEL